MKIRGFISKNSQYKVPDGKTSLLIMSDIGVRRATGITPVLYRLPHNQLFKHLRKMDFSGTSCLMIQSGENDYLVYLPKIGFKPENLESGEASCGSFKWAWRNWFPLKKFLTDLSSIADLSTMILVVLKEEMKISLSFPQLPETLTTYKIKEISRGEKLFHIEFFPEAKEIPEVLYHFSKEVITEFSDVVSIEFWGSSIHAYLKSNPSITLSNLALESEVRRKAVLSVLRELFKPDQEKDFKEKIEELLILKKLFRK